MATQQDGGVDTITRRAVDVLTKALGLVDLISQDEPTGVDALEERLDAAQAAIQTALVVATRGQEQPLELTSTLVDLMAVRDELRQTRLERRVSALDNVQRALSQLRGAPTAAAVMDRGLRELCAHCGFDRALLFRIDASEMVIDSVHFAEQPEWAAEFFDVAAAKRPQLTNLLLETEMLRRRTPMLVTDAQNDPRTLKPLVRLTKTTSYVAAPIMPAGRVIGFIHADCYFEGREVHSVDRDVLWAFAEGFGFAVERAVLIERLRQQRSEISRLVASTEAVLNEVCESEVALVRGDAEAASVARSAASMFLAPESRVDALLTRRELEVLSLMADGATNGSIASQLVISESTVKSHVKHIMRKLRAGNRAEAVSRYHRIANARSRDGGADH